MLCLKLIQDGASYYLGNSSTLEFEGTSIAFGERTSTIRETESQSTLSSMGISMLPFNAFLQVGLKITETKIIYQSGPETVKRQVGIKKGKPYFENVHSTGANLFQKGEKCFLFDIDRAEIKHGIFNPFIVELPHLVKTAKDAYASLIPSEVKEASMAGKEVLRQGEHFFIKMFDKSKLLPDDSGSGLGGTIYKTAILRAQGNRDHVATLFNEKSGLVSGSIKHNRREHRDLDLSSGWWKPIPNTAVKSFTLTGDVD